MGSYSEDRRWSDRYIRTVKRIVGPRLLITSPFDVDTRQAADLIVLTGRNVTVAARVRRATGKYAERYPYDFTIRAARDNGVKTELSKILDGWGDWFFYGHVDDDSNCAWSISRWMIVSLDAFRESHALVHPKPINNGDGTHGVAYDVRKFPGHSPILLDASFHYRDVMVKAA